MGNAKEVGDFINSNDGGYKEGKYEHEYAAEWRR
jgi:hypothetical protein